MCCKNFKKVQKNFWNHFPQKSAFWRDNSPEGASRMIKNFQKNIDFSLWVNRGTTNFRAFPSKVKKQLLTKSKHLFSHGFGGSWWCSWDNLTMSLPMVKALALHLISLQRANWHLQYSSWLLELKLTDWYKKPWWSLRRLVFRPSFVSNSNTPTNQVELPTK